MIQNGSFFFLLSVWDIKLKVLVFYELMITGKGCSTRLFCERLFVVEMTQIVVNSDKH